LSWWALGAEHDPYQKRKKFRVKLCPKCNKAWQIGNNEGKMVFEKIDEFPTYGLKRVKCKKC